MVNCFIVLSLFVLTSVIYISAEMLNVKWRKTFINSGVKNSIVGANEPSTSVLSCSVECSKSSQFGSFYYSSTLQECYCNTNLDVTVNTTTVDTGLIYGIRDTNQIDCLSLYQQGFSTDGVYVIYPMCGVPVETWCDMTGGGWTVIQRRQDGSEEFNRTWIGYVKGFGNKTGEYWLGLDNIHALTKDNSTVRIELKSLIGNFLCDYSHFEVGASETKYMLSVSGFTGNCTDKLSYHDGMMFSTPDFDNDYNITTNCASKHWAGWWYKSCQACNLNMRYAIGIDWYSNTVSKCVMKIKRNI